MLSARTLAEPTSVYIVYPAVRWVGFNELFSAFARAVEEGTIAGRHLHARSIDDVAAALCDAGYIRLGQPQ